MSLLLPQIYVALLSMISTKDFVVFTLGPPGSIRVDASRLRLLGSLAMRGVGHAAAGHPSEEAGGYSGTVSEISTQGGPTAEETHRGRHEPGSTDDAVSPPSTSPSAVESSGDLSGSSAASSLEGMSQRQIQRISSRLSRNPYQVSSRVGEQVETVPGGSKVLSKVPLIPSPVHSPLVFVIHTSTIHAL